MRNNLKQQNQFKISERNGQLVFALNSEKIIPENAPVRLACAMLEELDYEKLYGAYSPIGRKSAADPRVLFKVLVFGYMCGIYTPVPAVNLKIEAKPMLENVLLRELIAAAIIFLLGVRPPFILARPGMRRTGP